MSLVGWSEPAASSSVTATVFPARPTPRAGRGGSRRRRGPRASAGRPRSPRPRTPCRPADRRGRRPTSPGRPRRRGFHRRPSQRPAAEPPERVHPEAEPDCSAGGGDRRGSRRREEPAPSHRDDRRRARLRPGGLEDPLTEVRRRLRAVGAVGELAGNVTQAGHLAASVAVVEVPLVRPAVLGVEGIERVRGGLVVDLGLGHAHHSYSHDPVRWFGQSSCNRANRAQIGEKFGSVSSACRNSRCAFAFRPRQLSIIPRWK